MASGIRNGIGMDRENECFCELAPLYALDLLSAEERQWMEQQIGECADLSEELADYEMAVTAFPYGVATPPIASDLKGRLFDRLALELPPDEPPPYQAIRERDLHWQDHPTPGVRIAIVHRDEETRELVGFLRADPGVRYPFHRHAAIEEIFMIEGDLIVGDQVYGPGDYLRSLPGSAHAPYTLGGCRFFFHTSIDDQYPEAIETAFRF
jgi:hypothetical protein